MALLLDIAGGSNSDVNSVGWIRTPYGVRIVEDPFFNPRSILEYIQFATGMLDEAEPKPFTKEETVAFNELNSIMFGDEKLGKDFGFDANNSEDLIDGKNVMTMPIYADSRVGGQEAINPLWQFNRDDDITPEIYNSGNQKRRGMGRVYAEKYYSKQKILWLQPGLPRYKNIFKFLFESFDAEALDYNRNGFLSMINKVFKWIIKGAVWAITWPVVGPWALIRWFSDYGYNEISGYLRFEPCQIQYYEYVNSMLSYLAVGMGLYPYTSSFTARQLNKLSDTAQVMTEEKDGVKNQYAEINGFKGIDYDKMDKDNTDGVNNIPEILRDGPDIFKILNRRAKLYDPDNKYLNHTTRELTYLQQHGKENGLWEEEDVVGKDGKILIEKVEKKTIKNGDKEEEIPIVVAQQYVKENEIPSGWTKVTRTFMKSLTSTLYCTFDFFGFRIADNGTVEDSFSNSTEQLGVFSTINDVASNRRRDLNNYGGSIWLKGMVNAIRNAMTKDGATTITETLKNLSTEIFTRIGASALSGIGIGLGSAIQQGDGYFEVPEVWSNYSYDRSFTFTIQLRSRYGDPLSIFQSIYLPMLMLLVLASPRRAGEGTYTQPYCVKAICKGHLHVPMGMITNISVTRGRDRFGWNTSDQPTSVDVNLTIKDLSPSLFSAAQNIGFFDTFGHNTGTMNWLDTLAGLDLYEMLYSLPRKMRILSAAKLVRENTLWSPTYWGMWLGMSTAGRIANNFFDVQFSSEDLKARRNKLSGQLGR